VADNAIKRVIQPWLAQLGEAKLKKHFDRPPVLIGGCGRSGTTLLLSILSAHPGLYGIPHEVGMMTEWKKITGADHKERWHPYRMDRFYRYILFRPIPGSARRYCEKTPKNILWLEQILEYFNNDVKIIHLVRDGRDVMTSRHPERPTGYWIPIWRYIRDLQAGLRFDEHPSVYRVRYEDLILKYEPTIRAICDFIGEETRPELLNWFDHARVRQNRAWFRPVEKLHTNSVGKWQKPEYRDRVREIMADETVNLIMRRLGYIE